MPNVRLSDAIAQFTLHASTSYAEGTVRNLRSSLDLFLTEAGNIWLKNVTVNHVDRFTEARHSAGINPLTVRNDVTRLRMFFTWARQRKYMPVNADPVGSRRTKRVIPHKWTIIEPKDFPRLLDNTLNARDRAIVAFGLYTLVRQSEVAAATVGDLDLAGGWVTVKIQKSGAIDQMPVSAELSVEMHRWIQAYELAMGGPLDKKWKLFPALKPLGFGRDEGGRLMPVPEGMLRLVPDRSPAKIHWAVQRALERMGHPAAKEGVHTLRRSAARARFDQLVGEGYDGALREVQSLLHHKHAVTTEGYLGVTIESRKRDDSIRGRRMFGPQDTRALRVASA